MREDDGGRAGGQRRSEDVARLERGDIQPTHGDGLAADGLVAGIEVEDAEALPGAGAQVLEAKERLARRRDDGRRAVGRDMPTPRKLADGQETANLRRTEAMATCRVAKVARWALDDPALRQQRLDAGEVTPLANEGGE